MKKILLLTVGFCLCLASYAQQPFDGHWSFSDADGRFYYVHFSTDGDHTNDTIKVQGASKGLPGLNKTFNVLEDTLGRFKELYLFSDHGTIDSLVDVTGQRVSFDPLQARFANQERISFGRFNQQPVTNFRASASEFSGKVNLSWDLYPGADGYLIFRNKNGDTSGKYAQKAYAIIRSGLITTYDDYDVLQPDAIEYYIVAYHLKDADKRFISHVAYAKGGISAVDYDVFNFDEEVLVHRWAFDNTLLQDREFQIVNVALSGNNTLIKNREIDIQTYNHDHSRLELRALSLNQTIAGDSGTCLDLSGLSWGNTWTLETWIKVPAIEYASILSGSSDQPFLWIENGTLKAIGATGSGNVTFSVANNLLSNYWYHLALTKEGNELSLYLNGEKQSWTNGTTDVAVPAITKTIAPAYLGKTSSRGNQGTDFVLQTAMVRLWEVVRSKDQIKDDRFDSYTQEDPVVNLQDQWTFADETVPVVGLKGTGLPIKNIKSNILWQDAYIFDTEELVELYKERRGLNMSGRYEIEIREKGDGAKLAEQQDDINRSETELKNYVNNAITNVDRAYTETAPGEVTLDFFADSHFPDHYDLMRIDLDTRDTLTLAQNVYPERITHSGVYEAGRHSFSFDSVGIEAHFSFGLMYRTATIFNQEAVLAEWGNYKLIVDEENRMYLEVVSNFDGSEASLFVQTHRAERWNEVLINVKPSDAGGNVKTVEVYAGGVKVNETDIISGSFTPFINLEIPERQALEVGYVAAKGSALATYENLQLFNSTPDIRNGWEVLYHTTGEESPRLATLYRSSSVTLNYSDLSDIVLNETPGFNFFNRGNLHGRIAFHDGIEEGLEHFQADKSYQYFIIPRYISTYTPQDSLGVVSQTINTLKTQFQAVPLAKSKGTRLSWSLSLQTLGFDSVKLYRNDELIASVFKGSQYEDEGAIAGTSHQYRLEIIKEGQPVIAAYQSVNLAANGELAGLLLSRRGEYAVRNQSFPLNYELISSDPLVPTTDQWGQFRESNVFYGQRERFIAADPDDGGIVLTQNKPKSSGNWIRYNKNFKQQKVRDLFDSIDHRVIDGKYLAFDFKYTKDMPYLYDSLYINVYVNDSLVDIMTPLAIDTLGPVWADRYTTTDRNDYAFKAYFFKDQENVVFDEYELPQVQNVTIPSITDFTVTNSATYYVPELRFGFEENSKIEGFAIYRDSIQLGYLSRGDSATKDTYVFLDQLGIPGHQYTYMVIPVNVDEVADTTLASSKITSTYFDQLYPLWESFGPTDEVRIENDRTFTLTARATTGLFDHIPLDGVMVKNHGRLEAMLPFAQGKLVDGLSRTLYFPDQTRWAEGENYTLSPYKYYRDSSGNIAIHELPVSVPMKVRQPMRYNHSFNVRYVNKAAGEARGFAKVVWDQPDPLPAYYVVTYGSRQDTIYSPGLASYAITYDSLNDFNSVDLYACTDGTCDPMGFNKHVTLEDQPYTDAIAIPKNVSATQDAAGVIAVQWEYDAFALASFEIYRDGVLLDTLPTTARSYLDESTELIPGEYYTYQLRAFYQEKTAPYRGAIGRMHHRATVKGTIKNQEGHALPFVEVALDGHVTQTNAAGFYAFENLNIPSREATLTVLSPDTQVADLTKTVPVDPYIARVEDFQLKTPFQTHFEDESHPHLSVLSAYTNINDLTTELYWDINTDQHTGFEVYRDNLKLANIGKGERPHFVDSTAEPGFTYDYKVVATGYNENSVEVALTELVTPGTTAEIAKVMALSSHVPEGEGTIHLTYVHPYHNVTGYTLVKDGAFYSDTTAFRAEDPYSFPGGAAQYKVVAYLARNGKNYENIDNPTIMINTPPVAVPLNFTATPNPASFSMDLEWEWPANATTIDKGVISRIVEQQEIRLGEVDKATTTFNDGRGVPNTRATYSLKMISRYDGIESSPVLAGAMYPAIDSVKRADIALAGKDGQAQYLEAKWSFGTTNIDFFEIELVSDHQTLQVIKEAKSGQSNYTHDFGEQVPGKTYTFYIRAARVINDHTYYSKQTHQTMVFDGFNKLSGDSVGFDPNAMVIDVAWEYEHFDIDQFELLVKMTNKGYEETIPLNAGKRSHRYILPFHLNDLSTTDTFNVELIALKTVDGITTRSALLSKEGIEIPKAEKEKYLTKKISASNHYTDYVAVRWDTYGVTMSNGDVLKVYREDVMIHSEVNVNGSLASRAFEWEDFGETGGEAVAGSEYLYSVRIYGSDGKTLKHALFPDLGKRKPTAEAIGQVLSTISLNTPVNDRPLMLVAPYNGGYYFEEKHTTKSGTVSFQDLPAFNKDGSFVEYELRVATEPELYDKTSVSFQFNSEEETQGLDPFLYSGGDHVVGVVKYTACSLCGLKDVKLDLYAYDTKTVRDADVDGSQSDEFFEANSDENGAFAFTVLNTDQVKYYKLRATPAASHQAPDTTYQLFSSADFDAEGNYHLQIEDTTSFKVNVKITDACLESLGDYEFKVRVTDRETFQYDSAFTTSLAGLLEAEVPPYNLAFHVVGALQSGSRISAVLDYFRSRGELLPLKDWFVFEINELTGNESNDTTSTDNASGYDPVVYQTAYKNLSDSLAKRHQPYVFHQTPELMVEFLENADLTCDDPVVAQNQQVKVAIRVIENGCNVIDGSISVINWGANVPLKTSAEDPGRANIHIPYRDDAYQYEFMPQGPNIVAPYTYSLEVIYADEQGNPIATRQVEYITTGTKSLAGADVFVEPGKDEDDNVQYPIYVLRDPPGDHSYAYIEEGANMDFYVKSGTEIEVAGTVKFADEFELLKTATVNTDEMSINYKQEDKNFQKVSISFKERISTAKESKLSTNLEGYLDGPEADVIVGLGFAYAYGIEEKLTMENCEPSQVRNYNISSDEIATQWYYTRSMIRQTARYYRQLAEDLANGKATFSLDDPQILPVDQGGLARAVANKSIGEKLIQYAENWERIDEMTGAESAPPCVMCRETKKLMEDYLEVEIPNGVTIDFTQHIDKMAGKMLATIRENTGTTASGFVRLELRDVYNKIRSGIVQYLTSVNNFCKNAGNNVCEPSDAINLTKGQLDAFKTAYEDYFKFKYVRGYIISLEDMLKFSLVDQDQYAAYALAGAAYTAKRVILPTLSASFEGIASLEKNIKEGAEAIEELDEYLKTVDEMLNQSNGELKNKEEALKNLLTDLDTKMAQANDDLFKRANAYVSLRQIQNDVWNKTTDFDIPRAAGGYHYIKTLPEFFEQNHEIERELDRIGNFYMKGAEIPGMDLGAKEKGQKTGNEILKLSNELKKLDEFNSFAYKIEELKGEMNRLQTAKKQLKPYYDKALNEELSRLVDEVNKYDGDRPVLSDEINKGFVKKAELENEVARAKYSSDAFKEVKTKNEDLLKNLKDVLERDKELLASKKGSVKVDKFIRNPDDSNPDKLAIKESEVPSHKASKGFSSYLPSKTTTAAVTVGGVVVSAGFAVMAMTAYDILRGIYQDDLKKIADLKDQPMTSVLGYELIRNVTISGGVDVAAEIGFMDTDSETMDAYWGVEGELSLEKGKRGNLKTLNGIPGNGTRNDLMKIGTKPGLGIGMFDKQYIGTQTDTTRSFKTGYVLNDDDDGDRFNTWIIAGYSDRFTQTQLSPYFMLVGGTSSNPYEEGTLSRDYPTIDVVDKDGNRHPTVYINEDPEVALTIPIQLTSGNKFAEGRALAVTISPNSNNNGAQLLMANAELFTGRANGYFIHKDSAALYTNLIVEPKPGIFDYDDIELVVRPMGVKDDFFAEDPGVFDTLRLQVNFRKGPSPVFISDHEGQWFINKPKEGEEETFTFNLTGFDVEGKKSDLDYIKLEYKAFGDDARLGWNPMFEKVQKNPVTNEGEVGGSDTVGVRRLTDYYEAFRRTYVEPTYPFTWDIANGFEIIDGTYDVRATAFTKNGLFAFSNIYTGVIDRKAPRLLSKPEPADGVLSQGDPVFFSMDEPMSKEELFENGEILIDVYNSITNEKEDQLFFRDGVESSDDVSVIISDTEVNIQFSEAFIFFNDGKRVEITVNGVMDRYRNPIEDTIRWDFIVDQYKQLPPALTIQSPSSDFVVNKARMDADGMVPVVVTGYDPYNKFSDLSEIIVQARREGGDWVTLANRSREALAKQFEETQEADDDPVDVTSWDLTGELDGVYDIRAVSRSSYGKEKESNMVSNARVDRIAPFVVGIPQPSDLVLGQGEVASVSFSEAIDEKRGSVMASVWHQDDGEVDRFNLAVTASDASISFEPSLLDTYKGDSLYVKLWGVYDIVGNPLTQGVSAGETLVDTVKWSFIVDHKRIPASPVSLANESFIVNAATTDPVAIIFKNYELRAATTRIDSIELSYKRTNETDWTRMASYKEQQLIDRFDAYVATGWLAKDDFPIDTLWFDAVDLSDGSYEVRARAFGGNQFNESNYVSGVVDRTPPQVQGAPSPVGGVLTFTDQAGISFTETINYSLLPADSLMEHLTIMTFPDNDALEEDEFTVSAGSSSIQLSLAEEVYDYYFRRTFTVRVEGVEDLYGNPLFGEAEWEFRLDRFNSGPSDVQITAPSTFVSNIERRNETGTDVSQRNTSAVEVKIEGYDVGQITSSIEQFVLQYKRSEAGEDAWQDYATLSISDLLDSYDVLISNTPNALPEDYFYFNPAVVEDGTSDVFGSYDLRVVSQANGRERYSNVVSGVIDHQAPAVQAYSPASGVMGRSDEISVSFNETIDVNNTSNISYSVALADGRNIGTAANFELVISSGKLTLLPTGALDLLALDGQALTVTVDGVTDVVGNPVTETVSWSFTIDYYRKSASPISIKSPKDFVVNHEENTLEIVVEGFDLNPANFLLDELHLYYQVQEDGAPMELIGTLSRQNLIDVNVGNSGALEARYTWMIPNELQEASIHLQAVTTAVTDEGKHQRFESSLVSGLIDRVGPFLTAFDPTDGVYGRGDMIRASFNEALLENELPVYTITLGAEDYTNFFRMIPGSSSLTFDKDPTKDFGPLQGEDLTFELANIFDRSGNPGAVVSKVVKIDNFNRPPSPVVLKSTDLQINRYTLANFPLLVGGYDVDELNTELDSLVLEIRETTGANTWLPIDRRYLDELKAARISGLAPEVEFLVSPRLFKEGHYEVRVLSYGNGQYDFSNSISIEVDRILPVVTFQPQDGYLTFEDYLGFTVNESIVISEAIDLRVVRVISEDEEEDITSLFTNVLSGSGVELLINDYNTLAPYDGVPLELRLNSSVYDLLGNRYDGPEVFPFTVDFRKTDISIYEVIDPTGELVVNKHTPQTIDFVIQGYDLSGLTQLERVELLVQYPDRPNEWQVVTQKFRRELNPLVSADVLTQDTLQFDILPTDPEGKYLLQFRSYGTGDQFHVVHGEEVMVDRLSPSLVTFDPQDGVLSVGDAVQFSFDESLRPNPLVGFTVWDASGTKNLTHQFHRVQTSGTVTIQPLVDLLTYHGEQLTVRLDDIYDVWGNAHAGTLTRSFQVDYLTRPPSPVALKGLDGFVVNSHSEPVLELLVDSYDLYQKNYTLDSLVLEVRREGGAETWVALQSKPRDPELVSAHTDKLLAPEIYFSVNTLELEDGRYDVRVVSYGGEAQQFTFSNTIAGTLDRVRPTVVAFSPEDSIYNRFDQVEVTFSESIPTESMNENWLSLANKNGPVPVHTLYAGSQSISLTFLEDLAAYQNDTLLLMLNDELVSDESGNLLDGMTELAFVVNVLDVSPSPVELLTSNVVVNKSNGEVDRSFVIGGYELYDRNYGLDKVQLQYQMNGTEHWRDVPDASLTKQALLQHYDALLAARGDSDFTEPVDTLHWRSKDFIEGGFKVRVVTVHGSNLSYSNTVSGLVDRVSPEVIANGFSLVDQVFRTNDAISVEFSERINYEVFDPSWVTLENLNRDVVFPVEELETYATSSTIGIDFSKIGHYKGDSLRMTIGNVTDFVGNPLEGRNSWTFMVEAGCLLELETKDVTIWTSEEEIHAGVPVVFNTDIDEEYYEWEFSWGGGVDNGGGSMKSFERSPLVIFNIGDVKVDVKLTLMNETGCTFTRTEHRAYEVIGNDMTVIDDLSELSLTSKVTVNATTLEMYPNPSAREEVTISFTSTQTDLVHATIYGMNKAVLDEQDFEIEGGETDLTLDLRKLSSEGLFVVMLQADQFAIPVKLVLQKN